MVQLFITINIGGLSMKTDNKNLIKKLGRLGVLDTEPIKNDYISRFNKNENDITIENDSGVTCKVVTDNVTDEELPLMIMTEQLSTLKSIRKMVKYFYISALIAVGIWLLFFLIELGNKL